MNNLDVKVHDYLTSWEGMSSVKGSKYQILIEAIEDATIHEILGQYNQNCSSLQNQVLNELISEELHERILSDATFSITTVWRSIKEWLKNPYVTVQLGFDDDYPIIDDEQEPIFEDDPVAKYIIMTNQEFPEEAQRDLIEKFLFEVPTITLQIDENQIKILDIDDLPLFPVLSDETPDVVTIPLKIYHTPDLHLLYMMINNIRNKNYEVIDLYSRYRKQIEEEQLILASTNGNHHLSTISEVIPLPSVEDLMSKIKSENDYPALWKKIHITAYKCNSEQLERFSKWIWQIAKNMPCDCKWHALKYIQDNPPYSLDSTLPNILFHWTWQFHNDVNERLEKPQFAYEDALSYYENM
jgi:hypothetical protein